ncbi:MAG: rhodanese-like domain-containing protein [Sulfuricaulis sp.]|uniref:rhodanese-like domain-containing protein n=1 Tax=Sulfuricaulis sp. TaxID=2003553 RepID=UPI003C58A3A1
MNSTWLWSLAAVTILFIPTITLAAPADEEKKVFAELSALIPKDRVASVDDLYKKWQEVQAKKSKAIILDIRSYAEFYAGHLDGSNNISSGHPYLVPKTWPDPNTEIWVFCRTQHRATYFTSFLYRYGYKNVYLVKGGIADWAEKGYPLFSKDFGEIKVLKYNKELKEEYEVRPSMN